MASRFPAALPPACPPAAVRPAAYRTTLELAPHIDAQHIEASLHSGILTLTFPYRRQPRHQPQPQPQAQHGRHTAATPAGSDPLQAFCRLAAAAAAAHADAGAAETQRVERCRRHHRAPAAAHAPYRHPHHQQQRRACKSPEQVRGTVRQSQRACGCLRGLSPVLQRLGTELDADPSSPLLFLKLQDQQARHVRWQDDDASPAATGAAQPQRCRCPALPERRARQQQQQQQQQAGPSRPAAAAHPPVEPAHPGAAPAPVEDPKGKAPASAEQAAELERQQAARRAAERIAAGSGSDSDWEVADGAVEDCPLEG